MNTTYLVLCLKYRHMDEFVSLLDDYIINYIKVEWD